ncbi:hypothetical protein C1H46_038894 [Malus baccata]|uniref:Uncharacterized protein n=1 Tax=Malus baccata TaxID=106549 RepID=A0A540KN24_MALBA|nr:hypothetical protein C1H46_038894 [Malus baccata]
MPQGRVHLSVVSGGVLLHDSLVRRAVEGDAGGGDPRLQRGIDGKKQCFVDHFDGVGGPTVCFLGLKLCLTCPHWPQCRQASAHFPRPESIAGVLDFLSREEEILTANGSGHFRRPRVQIRLMGLAVHELTPKPSSKCG